MEERCKGTCPYAWIFQSNCSPALLIICESSSDIAVWTVSKELLYACIQVHSTQDFLHYFDALIFVYFRPLHSKNTLLHIASQFTEFIEIVTDCFSSVDGDQERRKTCSLLLTALFSISKTSDEGTSELRDILALHRNGLEWLADCVEPMHPGIDSSQSIPRGSLVWNFKVTPSLCELFTLLMTFHLLFYYRPS